MKNLVVLTGVGMSAESGINTFRDSGVGTSLQVYPARNVKVIKEKASVGMKMLKKELV